MSRDEIRNLQEDIAWLNKAEGAIGQVHSLVKHAIRKYHSDWDKVFENLQEAKDLAKTLPNLFERAGLDPARIKVLTAGKRRTLARDMFEIGKDASLQFLNEAKFPAIVILDFLDRSAAITELSLRIDSETFKASLHTYR